MSVDKSLDRLARAIAGTTRRHGQAVELARIGRVEDLAAAAGELRGRVRQPAGETEVVIRAPLIDATAWECLADALAASVQHLATLADGRLPPEDVIEGALTEPLVPDVDALDWSSTDPILVAAVVVRVAARTDQELGLLLAWRGQPTNELVEAVRTRRGTSSRLVPEAGADDPTASPGGTPNEAILLAPPAEPEALVRSLGPAPVPGVVDAVRAAAEFAWQLAAGAGDDIASDAVLLAELRGLGAATATDLAARLGIEADAARHALDELHAEGRVLRAGDRYRAA